MLTLKSDGSLDQYAFVDARGNTFPIAGKLPAGCIVRGDVVSSDAMFAMRSEPVQPGVSDDVMFAMRSEPVEPGVSDDVMFAMRSDLPCGN